MTASPRPWFRWSLRTMFVVVTIFGCWLGYELNWIRQRRQLVANPSVQALTNYTVIINNKPLAIYSSAPWPLCWMGEAGYPSICLPPGSSEAEVDRVRRLFPEVERFGVEQHPRFPPGE